MLPNQKPQVLMSGLAFGESPRWHEGRLWVSDWGTGEILAFDAQGNREVMVKLGFSSFQPICTAWLPDGRGAVGQGRPLDVAQRPWPVVGADVVRAGQGVEHGGPLAAPMRLRTSDCVHTSDESWYPDTKTTVGAP